MKEMVVAIVGRPNVGKSTIFNRLVGERMSIVEDIPGVTRDRLYGSAEWAGNSFRVIDTGGIQLANQPFQTEIRAQVDIAMEEADVILMVCDGQMGVMEDDRFIAGLLQKNKKPVVLAVNRIDDQSRMVNIYEFYELGLGDPMACSGIHGVGVGDVLDRCFELRKELLFPIFKEQPEMLLTHHLHMKVSHTLLWIQQVFVNVEKYMNPLKNIRF